MFFRLVHHITFDVIQCNKTKSTLAIVLYFTMIMFLKKEPLGQTYNIIGLLLTLTEKCSLVFHKMCLLCHQDGDLPVITEFKGIFSCKIITLSALNIDVMHSSVARGHLLYTFHNLLVSHDHQNQVAHYQA